MKNINVGLRSSCLSILIMIICSEAFIGCKKDGSDSITPTPPSVSLTLTPTQGTVWFNGTDTINITSDGQDIKTASGVTITNPYIVAGIKNDTTITLTATKTVNGQLISKSQSITLHSYSTYLSSMCKRGDPSGLKMVKNYFIDADSIHFPNHIPGTLDGSTHYFSPNGTEVAHYLNGTTQTGTFTLNGNTCTFWGDAHTYTIVVKESNPNGFQRVAQQIFVTDGRLYLLIQDFY